jgi:Fe-Mn family superoxide dismutase
MKETLTMRRYDLPDLPYDVTALEPHYSAEALELHHSKHHAAYVKAANTTIERIDEARAARDWTSIGGLEKSLAFNVSGHVLHSMLWQNMSPDGPGRPDGELASAIDEYFDSFDSFQALMSETADSVQGSGWAALAWEPIGRRLFVEQIYDHQGNVAQSGDLLLVLDVWEHAYYLQYRNERPAFVKAFWNLVNWPDVQRRFSEAMANSTAKVR